MLNRERPDTRSNAVVIRTLTDRPDQHPLSMGCPSCPSFSSCGGLRVEANLLDCLSLCCGSPNSCTRVCKNNPDRFVDQMREINGFGLGNVTRAPVLPSAQLESIIPLVQHGSRRERLFDAATVALPLPHLINYRKGLPRFETRQQLCETFKISENAKIILTGVNPDERIEPYWGLSDKRAEMIDYFLRMGIALVTAPNFSVVLDHPRFDDMHAMKRIAILFSEFQNAGLACALHPNGRTDRDFQRWAEFIAQREEVTTIAYEFTTGTGRKDRIGFHLEKLGLLVKHANRPLDLVVRGKSFVIPELRKIFRHVSYIESASFMKSMKRQRAQRTTNQGVEWIGTPTPVGASIDTLFEHNFREQVLALRASYFADKLSKPEAA